MKAQQRQLEAEEEALRKEKRKKGKLMLKEVLAANGPELTTVAVRPHVVFGPHDQRFLPAILKRASDGRLKFGVGRGR